VYNPGSEIFILLGVVFIMIVFGYRHNSQLCNSISFL